MHGAAQCGAERPGAAPRGVVRRVPLILRDIRAHHGVQRGEPGDDRRVATRRSDDRYGAGLGRRRAARRSAGWRCSARRRGTCGRYPRRSSAWRRHSATWVRSMWRSAAGRRLARRRAACRLPVQHRSTRRRPAWHSMAYRLPARRGLEWRRPAQSRNFDADDTVAWSGGAPTDQSRTQGEGVTDLVTRTGGAAGLARAQVLPRCLLGASDYAAQHGYVDAADTEPMESKAATDDQARRSSAARSRSARRSAMRDARRGAARRSV